MKILSTLLLIAAVAAGIDANSAEVTRIAAGNHTMLLTKDGKIYVSGNNDAGQLGDGHYYDSEISDNHYNATTFKPVEKDGVKFRSVTATLYNSYAIASDATISSVSIYNANGQKVGFKMVDGTQTSLNVSHLAAGTYFVATESGAGKSVARFIKK